MPAPRCPSNHRPHAPLLPRRSHSFLELRVNHRRLRMDIPTDGQGPTASHRVDPAARGLQHLALRLLVPWVAPCRLQMRAIISTGGTGGDGESFDSTGMTIGRASAHRETVGDVLEQGGLSRACLERIGVIGISLHGAPVWFCQRVQARGTHLQTTGRTRSAR